jgi:hypothetical protein
MSHPTISRIADAYLRRQAGLDSRFVRAVSTALSLWDQREPLIDGLTVSEAMRMGAAEWSWDLLSGRDNPFQVWAMITEDPRGLVQFLQRALQRPYREATQGDSRAVLR